MNKKTEEKLKELLVEIGDIAKKEKCSISIFAKENGWVTGNNNHWELAKRKGFDFWTNDRGKTWTSLF